MTIIEKIAPYERKQGNSQKWFDGDMFEKLNLRRIFFKKFKK